MTMEVTYLFMQPISSEVPLTYTWKTWSWKHLGQAFRIGRHPINFHYNGDLTGSYIRNCSIHHSFNRGITIDSSMCVDISDNVLFNIQGIGVVLETGNDIDNIIKHNLVLSSVESGHLQNEDRGPAAFWISHSQNSLMYNSASGGTHIVYWYNKYPIYSRLTLFEHNDAHSNGMYGLWISNIYRPSNGVTLSGFKSWNNHIGLEIKGRGAVHLKNMFMINNEDSNIILKDLTESHTNNVMFHNSLLVAVDSDLNVSVPIFRTTKGLQLPTDDSYRINNITFIGYNGSKYAITVSNSEVCELITYATSNLTFISSPRKIVFSVYAVFHQVEDMDGSFCGLQNRYIVPSSDILSSQCQSLPDSNGQVSHCSSVFHLLLLDKRQDISLKSKQIYIMQTTRYRCNPYYSNMIENTNSYQVKLAGSFTAYTNESYYGYFMDMKVVLINSTHTK